MARSLKIRVISDIDRFTTNMDDAGKRQVPFALARALTWTAKDAQGDVRADLPKKFTLRNNFVSGGIKIVPARKGAPEAIVGSITPFMQRQEEGGTKTGKGGHRIGIPVKVKRNKRDIVPKSRWPAAVRGQPKTFVAKTGSGIGILRRVGRARYPLQILYWLKRGVKVQPRFGFKNTTGTSVTEHFGSRFVESLSQAMGHRG
jgi:hypothetical protein